MREALEYIGQRIGREVSRQYPFASPEAAAIAFINFAPRKYYGVYEPLQMNCMETFIRASLCSILQRHPSKALRNLVAFIRETPLQDSIDSLRNNELPLRFDARDALIDLIAMVTEEFTAALMAVATNRAEAKMILIALNPQERISCLQN